MKKLKCPKCKGIEFTEHGFEGYNRRYKCKSCKFEFREGVREW